jgi:hypothetical protein
MIFMENTFMLAQSSDFLGTFVWIFAIILLSFLYPRIMLQQILIKLDQIYREIENMTIAAKRHIIRKINSKISKEIKESINNFMEFFAIEPVSLDPFGIIKKIEFISDLSEKRFKYFVKQIAPKLDEESKANLMMGLAGAIALNQLGKILRHFTELIRKTKSLQLAMVLQMQIPFIERLAKAFSKGTEALINGWCIGDSIGPLIAAELIGNSKVKRTEYETVICRKKIRGKDVIIVKAMGPGGRLGKLGKTVERIVKREKIAKIITIDAAAKLEGERTGSVAEGVGVAIGGIGVDKSYIENLAVEHDIPLDSIIIKMSQEEAIMPMKQEVLNSVGKVISLVEKNIDETQGKGKIIIVGVGNSSGVGDSGKEAEKAKNNIKKVLAILKKRGDLEGKQKGGISGWFGI